MYQTLYWTNGNNNHVKLGDSREDSCYTYFIHAIDNYGNRQLIYAIPFV